MKKDSWSKEYFDEYIKPERCYEEYAQFGVLEDMLGARLKDRYRSDEVFRGDMLGLLVKYSEGTVQEIDINYLKTMRKAFDIFIGKIESWKKQRR